MVDTKTSNSAPAGAWSVSVIGFGHPSDGRTSSGYARNLTTALRERGRLRREFSAKSIRVTDVFRGAIAMSSFDKRFKPSVRRAWLWSERGTQTLSERLDRVIRAAGDRGPFVQVGTLVTIDPSLGRHLMRTDMTIAQARRAGRLFAVTDLSARQLDAAQRVQADVLATADHVLAASQWTANSLVADCGVPREKITVLYTGGNLAIPERANEPRTPCEILFVGIDWERKGGPLLLEAFHKVRHRLPDATLRIVGCRPRGVEHPSIHVEGLLHKDDPGQRTRLTQCYLRASCFCLPTSFDPFPNALVEAARAGLAAVAIDNGSRREAIADGVTGALAKAPTAHALADALFDVLADPDRCRRMGEAARERAERMFLWDLVVQTIGRVLCESPVQPEEQVAAAI